MFKNNKKDTRMFIGIAIKGGARTPAIILDGEHCYNTLSVLRQMGESQNGCFKKKKNTPNSSKNEHSLPPDTHTHVCVSGGKKSSFFEEFGVLCFYEYPF